MLDILKMDFKRMFKSKSFYVINLTLIMFVIVTALVLRFSYNINYETFQKSGITISEQSDGESVTQGLSEEQYITMQQDLLSSTDVQKFLEIQYSSFVTTALLVVFIIFFIGSEIDSGFIKNVIPLNNSRSNLLFSKNLVMMCFIALQAIIAVVMALFGNLIVTNDISFVNINETIIYLSLQIGLRIAFGSFLIFLIYFLKAKTAALLIGILLALNIHVMLVGALNNYLYNINFNFIKYSLMANASISQFQVMDYRRVTMTSVVAFVVYNLMSLIRLKRVEIK